MEIPGLGLNPSPPPPAPPPQVVSMTNPERANRYGRDEKIHFTVVRFMFEAGIKLEMKAVTKATAAHLYHKVFRDCQLSEFDPYLIGTTCLYLAGKVEEDHKRIRDVINVCYRCIHPERAPLDIGSTYWALKESVTQCELFILRVLKFQVVVSNPHKYLLHYLRSLSSWLPRDVVDRVPFSRTAWALLNDSYQGATCLRFPAEWVAVAVLYLALQVHGVPVPHNDDAEYRWWEAFVEDMQLTDVRKIISEIIDTYNFETHVSG